MCFCCATVCDQGAGSNFAEGKQISVFALSVVYFGNVDQNSFCGSTKSGTRYIKRLLVQDHRSATVHTVYAMSVVLNKRHQFKNKT